VKKEIVPVNILLLIVLAVIWGSSYILMKKGLLVFSALQVSMLRIVFASAALMPLLPSALKNTTRKDIGYALLVAIMGSGIPSYLYPLSITNIDSGIAGIINALTPVFTMLFGWLIFKNNAGFVKILGLSLALTGAGFLILYNNNANQPFTLNWYALAAVLATVCYGMSSNILKAKLNHVNPAQLTSLTFFIIGPVALVVLLTTDFVQIVRTHPAAAESVGYIFLLGVMGTGFALVLFNHLIKRTDALYASSVTFLIPVVAVFWGLLDGEIIGPSHLVGLITILGGVYLMNKKTNKI
jgi:drug/metabolite transporter (DMT)-like permease